MPGPSTTGYHSPPCTLLLQILSDDPKKILFQRLLEGKNGGDKPAGAKKKNTF